jgi:hypothetical protein
MRIPSTLWVGSEGCSEKLHRKEELHKCLFSAAVLPPALMIGDESTLAPLSTKRSLRKQCPDENARSKSYQADGRHRAIGDGSFPFAPHVQTARECADGGSGTARRSAHRLARDRPRPSVPPSGMQQRRCGFFCRRPWKTGPCGSRATSRFHYPPVHRYKLGQSL